MQHTYQFILNLFHQMQHTYQFILNLFHQKDQQLHLGIRCFTISKVHKYSIHLVLYFY